MVWLFTLALLAPGSAFAVGFNYARDSSACEDELVTPLDVSESTRQLIEVLDRRPLVPNEVIDFLASRPALRRVGLHNLFDHPVREGVSLRAHVIRTLDVFKTQEHFYVISPELKRSAMLALILRHATAAMINQDFLTEHGHLPRGEAEVREAAAEVDDSIAPMTMMIAQALGLDDVDVAMVYIMSWGEHIKEVLNQTIAPEAATDMYRDMQRDESNEQNLREWFAAKTLMFVAETESDSILTEDQNGRLMPSSPLYEQLKTSLEPLFPKEI